MDEGRAPIVGQGKLEARIVRYQDLRPCYNAFVDTRTPGSEAKENFTIIGPGVSENPAQHVHIAEPHGFNIGGARQPPHCINSQHSHDTAEVFVVHTGQWRFDLGEHGEDAQVFVGPGDLISLPTGAFRGFTNVGEDTGFLWAILGEDDPGRVTWAPQVFEMAKDYGLVLMENGLLVDTVAGERAPEGLKPLAPTTTAEAGAMKRVTQAEAEALVVRMPRDVQSSRDVIIGTGGPLAWPHGFDVVRYVLSPKSDVSGGQARSNVVLFVHEGEVLARVGGDSAALFAGDTLTVQDGAIWSLESRYSATVFAVFRTAPPER